MKDNLSPSLSSPGNRLNGPDNMCCNISGKSSLDRGNIPPAQLAHNSANNASSQIESPQSRLVNNTGLPDNIKMGVEKLSGYSMDDVKVHYNSSKPAQLQAHAYAQGTDIHVGPGQEQHLPHEAWHVVQQKQGRVKPTKQLKAKESINDDKALETEAEDMGDNVMQGKFASPVYQKKPVAASPQNIIQRNVVDSPTNYKDAPTIKAMTLLEFDNYAKEQADWHAGPKLTDADRQSIRQVVLFGRTPDYISACGNMTIADIESEITSKGLADVKKNLGVYSKAVTTQVPFEYHQLSSAAKAVETGENMTALMSSFPPYMLKSAMNKRIFDYIQNKNLIADLVTYYSTVAPKPIFQATNGADFLSYANMKLVDKVDPISFNKAPLVDNIRNYHRFQKDLLDRLALNFADTTKKKPLTLILHTAIDHNGAFHRDPNLTSVVRNNNIHTLMIEGKETLADVQSQLTPLAKKYGQNDKIDQVMIAGHGNARSIQLAGKVADDGKGEIKEVGEDIDLDNNKVDSDALILEVLKNMDDKLSKKSLQPHRRIVFNACLTNSNAVQAAIAAKNIPDAKKEILAYIKKNASLASYVQNMADANKNEVTSIGSNASFGNEVSLIDPTTNALDLISNKTKSNPDPDIKLTASKAEYVEFGKEPTGALRAVLETWATDIVKCKTAMQNRVKQKASSWDDVLIQTLYQIILTHFYNNPEAIRVFATVAEIVGHFKLEPECRPANFNGIENLGVHLITIVKALSNSTEWKANPYIPLVMYQAWMNTDKTDANPKNMFLSTLQSHFNCNTAKKYVDVGYLDTNGLLPALFKTKGDGQLIMALLGVMDSNQADCKSYLISELNAKDRFDPSKNITAKLAGLSTEDNILIKIGKMSAPPSKSGSLVPVSSSSSSKVANVRLGADTENKEYVRSVTYQGTIQASKEAAVFEKADIGSKKLTPLKNGTTVDIIGSIDTWWAIAYTNSKNLGTAFVQQSDVKVI